jgi:predicted ATPase with chaperone activity
MRRRGDPMWFPKRPQNLEEAKLTPYFLQESILKIIFSRGATRGIQFCEGLRLPYALIDSELKQLRSQDLIAPVGGTGVGGYEGMDFSLTTRGIEQAASISKRSPYAGSAPVSIEDYADSVSNQKIQLRWVKRSHLETAFADLIISKQQINRLGPAINSGGPIFLYGKPGNGKTCLAERLSRVFRQGIFVPYCIQIEGQIIQIFDEKVHHRIGDELLSDTHPVKANPLSIDPRWVYVLRPFIIVGGELTLEMLDLTFREGQDCYEAPFQVKSNGGVLLVDDFGRQIVRPKEFLNRWIFPLEKNKDFLTLVSGKKIEIPFEQVLIFSTNLNPADLADEAFWRRIKYKIQVPDPTENEYKQIFMGVCQKLKLGFVEAVYQHLIQTQYKSKKRELRSVHPRDILNHVVDYISYYGLEHKLTNELIDLASEPYFTEMVDTADRTWSKAG